MTREQHRQLMSSARTDAATVGKRSIMVQAGHSGGDIQYSTWTDLYKTVKELIVTLHSLVGGSPSIRACSILPSGRVIVHHYGAEGAMSNLNSLLLALVTLRHYKRVIQVHRLMVPSRASLWTLSVRGVLTGIYLILRWRRTAKTNNRKVINSWRPSAAVVMSRTL